LLASALGKIATAWCRLSINAWYLATHFSCCEHDDECEKDWFNVLIISDKNQFTFLTVIDSKLLL
jgi:hypothetical protein